MVDSKLKGSIVVLENISVFLTKLISELSGGTFEFIAKSFELWIRLVLLSRSLVFFVEGSLEILHKNLLLLLDPWTIDWVSCEIFSIIGNLQHLVVDGLSLGGGHTDGPESYGIPFVFSSLKGSFIVLESPSVLVLELSVKIHARNKDLVSQSLEL